MGPKFLSEPEKKFSNQTHSVARLTEADNKISQTDQTAADKQSLSATTVKSNTAAQKSIRVIELPNMRVVLNSQGASVMHWWIKEKHGNLQSGQEANNWPDLVNHPYTSTEDLLEESFYGLSTFSESTFAQVPCDQMKAEVIESCWEAVLPSGANVRKQFSFEHAASSETHFLNLTLSIANPTAKEISVPEFGLGWSNGVGTVPAERKENKGLIRLLAYPSPKKEVEKLDSGERAMDYSWVGVDNRYYLLALLPQKGDFSKLVTEKSKQTGSSLYLFKNAFTLIPGERKEAKIKIYGGIKGYTRLKKIGLGIEHAVDFGYFGFLGKSALKAMYFLYAITGNFGWSIIILTGIMQLIVFPLSYKSYQSMAAMKKLQPKIQEIQKRYKDDSKRMNQEMMDLYRNTKTNPFGGCIPMVLQIPVFWAFFTMLRNSYELRGAPWMFWIVDLSAKDPYYVLPIIMGGGMLLQQKISGPTGDPTQAKMMMFMPVIFTFMFLNFPSGLVLYWLTNSILTMTTQYCIRIRSEATA